MNSPLPSRTAASLSHGNSQWKDETSIAFESATAPAASARFTARPSAAGWTSSRGPGEGRERDGGDQLGVVLDAVTRIRLGPRPVEDELALRVQFDVGRGRPHQPLLRVHQDVRRDPSDPFPDTVVALQGIEEGVGGVNG